MAKKEKTKWKWSEMAEWKELQDKKEAERLEPEPARSGICPECGHGSFQLKIQDGQMDRICKGCGSIVENV